MKKLNFYIPITFLALTTIVFLYGIFFYKHSPNIHTEFPLVPPSKDFLLGTDDLGIDVFSQLSSGYFYSMSIGVFTACIAGVLGVFTGCIGGYFEGRVEDVVDFFISTFMSIPQLPILILIGAFFKPSVFNLVIVISLFSFAPIARVIKGNVKNIKNKPYIMLSKAYGGSNLYIIKNHILKKIYPLASISTIKVIGKAIIQESSLAFLGLADPTSKTWGLMINRCVSFKGIYFTEFWKWWLLPPVILLSFTILALAMVNKSLEWKFLKGEKNEDNRNKKFAS